MALFTGFQLQEYKVSLRQFIHSPPQSPRIFLRRSQDFNMRALALCPLLFGLRSLADTLISRNFPHLIIPVSRLEPDRVFNTQEEFDIERDVRKAPPPPLFIPP